ncbi:hypothetical protein ABC766_00010 [Methylobacterium fujisawaense]|jgi:hypothetical protein|uniref:hypothetical protein n=1 Tax=Methylobacterium fujisawaense TaxID=107400 RepID=UPI0031F58940
MTNLGAYIMGFAHGAVICSGCALFGQWLARRTIAKAAPLPETGSDTGGRNGPQA